MDLVNIFYAVAVVLMILWIAFLIFGIAILWKIYDTIKNAPARIEEKVSEFAQSKVASVAAAVGIPLITMIVKKIKERGKK